MATRASLYLKDELQKEVNKRPGGVSEQLERLFNCYKYCRRRIASLFTDAELDMLCYSEYYGLWSDDPEDSYGLYVSVMMALDDEEDFVKGRTDFPKERVACLELWLGKVDRQAIMNKIKSMHPFDILALNDVLEQAVRHDTPQRDLRYLLSRERSDVNLNTKAF